MNKIFTNDLRPGQAFSSPVYTEGDYLLVPDLVPVRQKDIDFLISNEIHFVFTDGELTNISEAKSTKKEVKIEKPVSIPENKIEELTEIENIFDFPDSIDDLSSMDEVIPEIPGSKIPEPRKEPIKFTISDVQQNTGPYRAYKNLIEKLSAIFTGIKTGVSVEMRAIENIGTHLLQDLRDNPDSFISYILGGEVSGQELAKSSVNTAIISALTAQELKLPNHKILKIVSGALLHDVGMLRLSKGITEKRGALSAAEHEQIKSHPVHTSKIVTKELFGSQEVNLIALQHHERWDGKGYPDKIMGPAIDLGARIVSVADAFEAMVSKKSYRDSIGGYQAIKNLLADNARRFDPEVIMAFTRVMGIYPIGSIVRLNDNSVARVVSINSNAPLRPVVQMLISKGKKVLKIGERATVDLLAEKSLFIKSAVEPEEFTGFDA